MNELPILSTVEYLNFIAKLTMYMLVVLAVISDLKTRKIPNQLTINGILCGIFLNMLIYGWANGSFDAFGLMAGLWFSFLGALLALVIGLAPFAVGGWGGGDVKLLMLIGAFVGVGQTFQTILYTAIAGGIVAVFYLIKRFLKKEKLFGNFLGTLKDYYNHYVYKTELVETESKQEKFPYSIAILAGLTASFIIPS